MKTLKTMLLCGALWGVAAGMGLGAEAAMAQEIKARFGTSLPDEHPQTLGARKFAELVGAKSKGPHQDHGLFFRPAGQ